MLRYVQKLMPLSTPEPQNTDTNGIHATCIAMTLLVAIQKTLRSEVTAHTFSFFVCIIYPQYKYAYVHNYSAHGHELIGCVRPDADAYI